MKTEENIFEAYKRIICIKCENQASKDCEIRKTQDGAKCLEYKKDKYKMNYSKCMVRECNFCKNREKCKENDIELKKENKVYITAKQQPPIMNWR